jgi:hypothetical protein
MFIRYPLFTLYLVASLFKYWFWTWGELGTYLIVDPPVFLLAILAAAELAWRHTEFLDPKLRRTLVGMVLGAAGLGIGLVLDTEVRKTLISQYTTTRMILHSAGGFALLVLMLYSALREWPRAHNLDVRHGWILAVLLLAHGTTAAITLPLKYKAGLWTWANTSFLLLRLSLLALWVIHFWPVRVRQLQAPPRESEASTRF